MNWYKKAQQVIILWHATIPRFADVIKEQGVIKPGLTIEEETGQNQAGWNFQLSNNIEYGEGVYLSGNKNLAIYYASLRLRKEQEKVEFIDSLYEEDYGYIGIFKISIINKNLLKDIGGSEEYIYLGNILSQPNPDAWYEGPEWIDKTKELDEYRTKLENIYKELLPTETTNNNFFQKKKINDKLV